MRWPGTANALKRRHVKVALNAYVAHLGYFIGGEHRQIVFLVIHVYVTKPTLEQNLQQLIGRVMFRVLLGAPDAAGVEAKGGDRCHENFCTRIRTIRFFAGKCVHRMRRFLGDA